MKYVRVSVALVNNCVVFLPLKTPPTYLCRYLTKPSIEIRCTIKPFYSKLYLVLNPFETCQMIEYMFFLKQFTIVSYDSRDEI